LPIEYQENGIQIGDVGTVTPEGLFDFLFNIYLPAHHPINLDNVPDDFCPLEPRYNEHRDIITILHDPGSHVTNTLFPGSDFNFHCRPPQGAVVALPHGALLKRLNVKAVHTVRDYARKHAQSWYRYMNGAENGSLYLITGWEKAKSWGMASYHS
ncbi:hypothetical protein C8R45DRAFT_789320, partial [Mycena sanguinolenta]